MEWDVPHGGCAGGCLWYHFGKHRQVSSGAWWSQVRGDQGASDESCPFALAEAEQAGSAFWGNRPCPLKLRHRLTGGQPYNVQAVFPRDARGRWLAEAAAGEDVQAKAGGGRP